MRTLAYVATMALVAGCMGREDGGRGWENSGAYDQAAPQPTDGGASTFADGGDTLGSGRGEPSATTPLHLLPNAPVDFNEGQTGFAVTADGKGGYRVAWVDAAGADRRYHGSIFCAGTFSQITSVGMQYATATGNRLDFQSQPGAGTEGYVDFVSSVDPIVVDVLDGANAGTLSYTDGNGVMQSAPTPATFTSP
jgi:hypothetical protein